MENVAGTSESRAQARFQETGQRLAGRLTPAAQCDMGRGAQRDLYQLLYRGVREDAFRLAYQPILDLRTGRIIGAEALLRLQEGARLICAGDFIETLENSDLLDTVAGKALHEACRSAAWIQSILQPDFRIAVNVAPQQWTRGGLSEAVTDSLRETGCRPAMLDLEITERTFMSDSPSVHAIMKDFRDQGITITLDDFGTGHANFACLKRFPITHLKIDKYYCRHAKAQTRVLEPVIGAAHRAGISCTAEGVETEAQLRHLTLAGCDEAQGFYVARPMDFESLVSFLQVRSVSNFWRHHNAS